MSEALYRKYRSKNLDEVIGQEHITTILKNSLKKRVSHAYLFTGPRGVGKTSVARILAKSVNNLTESDNGFYPDIIEIDAASNRRIEEMRELRDKIAIAPSQLKYKVYIIDEVHMLTREAFNALLKTLEEPPDHAIFILATTDAHKVPETISSRCIRLSFKLIPENEMVKHLKSIAKKENIEITENALKLVAEHSEGSFRDAISILDQVSHIGTKIEEKSIEALLGMADIKSIEMLISSISSKNLNQTLKHVQDMVDDGATPERIIKQITSRLRNDLINNTSNIYPRMSIDLIDELSKVYVYQDQRLGLEIALAKSILANSESTVATESIPDNTHDVSDENKSNLPIEIPQSNEGVDIKFDKVKQNDTNDHWEEILDGLKSKNTTIYGIARMANTSLIEDSLILKFRFPFHVKQIKLDKNFALLNEVILNINPSIKKIEIILDKDDESVNENPSSSHITNISNIFGSAEVLES